MNMFKTMMDMLKTILLSALVLIMFSSTEVSAKEWLPPDTEVFSGDYNNDGLPDLYLKATTKLVPIAFEILFFVPGINGNPDIILLNNGNGTYTLINHPSSTLISSATWAPSTTHELKYSDYNSDGAQDLMVQATTVGGVSVVIYAAASNEIPAIAKTIVRTQTLFDEDVTGRTSIDSFAGNDYSLASNGNYVGAIDGTFNVSSNGKPTYRIPLQLLPSVQNVAPNVALEYTGNSGNGILGVGWYVDGLSKIERCATTIDQDGYINGVNFNSSDKFCLNGQRLIAISGDYGKNLTEYRTENESFARVVSYGNLGGGPQYFVVQHVTGEIEEYGNTVDSRRMAQSSPSAAVTWAIHKKSDREGNYVLFTYNTDTASGFQYIDKISYTGNSTAGLTPANTVKFNYEPRSDITPSYADGAKRVIPVRVDNIEILLGASLVRKYDLSYSAGSATSRSRLSDISECLNDGHCLPNTIFSWDLGNEDTVFTKQAKEVDSSNYPTNLSYENQQYHLADVNGDGRSDLIWTYRHTNALGRAVYLANESGSGFTLASTATETGYTASTIPDADQSYISGDINGDGKADLVWTARYLDDFYYAIYIANASGTGFTPQGYQVDSHSDYALRSDGRYHLADVNGDGRKDLVWTFIYQNKLGRAVYQAYSDTSGKVAFGKTSYEVDPDYTPDYYTQNQYSTGDANGDGKEDFLWSFLYQEKFYQVLYLANENGTGFNKISVQSDAALHTLASAYKDSKVQLADANADGKMDIIWTYSVNNKLGRSLYLASDKGTSFVKKSSVVDTSVVRAPDAYKYKDTQLGDLNGDGRSDVLYTYQDDVNFGWIVYLSDTNGEGFSERRSAEISTTTRPSYINHHYMLGDTNADGKVDLVWAYNDKDTHALERVAFTLPASHPDHITKITDGFGNETKVKYRYLADTGSGFYTKGAAANYPVRDDEGLSYVVENIQKSDGVGGFNQWNYAYEGAQTNLQGRGFLGFKKRRVTDLQTGFVTTETYRQEYPFIGLQDSVVVTTNANTPLEKVYNHWKQAVITHPGAKSSVFSYLDDSVALKYNLTDGNLVFASLTDNTYNNALGNLDQQVVATGTGFTGAIDSAFSPNGTYTTSQVSNTQRNITTGFSYLNDTRSNWRIGFLQSKTETYTVPGTPVKSVRVEYTPYDNTSFLTRTETQFAGSNIWVKNTYDRDAYGNISSITVDAADIDGGAIASRHTGFGTYVSGLYPSSKTNSLNHTENYQYNNRVGELKKLTDANQLITDRIYDDFGRLVYEKKADGSDTKTIYNFCSILLSNCQAHEKYYTTTSLTHDHYNGVVGEPSVTQYFDSLGRELRSDTVGFNGQIIRKTTVYDNRGRMAHHSQPYYLGDPPAITDYTYDDLDRVTLKVQPDGGSTANSYLSDPVYSSRSITTQTVLVPGAATKTITTVVKSNSLEQMVEVIDAHNTPTKYTYDAQGNITSVKVNNDAATTVITETDIAGNKIRLVDPDAGEIAYAYSGVGELRQKIFDPSGVAHSISTTRDALGRVIRRVDNDGATVETATWVWDTAAHGKGLLASVSGKDYQKSYQYDSISRVKQTSTKLFGEASPKIVRHNYDGFSRPVNTLYPSGLATRTTYNAHGYTLQHKDLNSGAVYWTANASDAFGNTTKETLGNRLITLRHYDSATGRLDSIQTGTSGSPTKIQDLFFEYDTAGNLTSRSSSRSINGGEHIPENFIYDNLHRVTNADTTGLSSGARNLSYGYDALGNIRSKTGVSDLNGYYYGEGAAGPHAVSRVVLGGVTTYYDYDSKGNMITAGDRTIEYTVFNKPNRITRPNIETLFQYGPERQRFYQQHTAGADVTTTRYYDGFEVVEQGGVTREKAYIGDYMIHTVVKQSNGSVTGRNVSYLHRDNIGSVDSITDQNGNLLDRMAYDPFGSRRQADWEDSTPAFEATLASKTFNTTTHGFTDHEHIDSVGFIHMNGRMYDPVIGRFLSPDDYVQFPEFSQSYNRYSYVLNNPLTHTDESGEFIPVLVYGAVLAWRAYNVYDTVSSGIQDAKVVLDKNASTSDRIISGLSITSGIVGGKPFRTMFGNLSKKFKSAFKNRRSAQKAKSSQPEKSSGNDGNTENVPDKPVDGISLSAEFKDGMNVKEFNRKINRIENAVNDGRATSNIPHNISDAERRAVTRKYRKDLQKRIESFYANDSVARDNALKRLRNSDIDHMLDLQLDGQNVRYNLKTLDSRVNQELGRQFSTQLPRGERIPIIDINVNGLPESP